MVRRDQPTTGSVGGAAQVLDLSSIAKYGGHLVDLDTWTIDAGYGVDDNLVFITSNGEVIVYRGTDPSSAATWALAGVSFAESSFFPILMLTLNFSRKS